MIKTQILGQMSSITYIITMYSHPNILVQVSNDLLAGMGLAAVTGLVPWDGVEVEEGNGAGKVLGNITKKNIVISGLEEVLGVGVNRASCTSRS